MHPNPAPLLRRQLLLGLLALPAAAWSRPPDRPLVEVWKDPNCGCCRDWMAHLEKNGFQVKAYDTGNAAARRHLGMPAQLGSCHTGRVQGYVIEGHVPARDIQRLLNDKPAAIGLAVPGMPIGSPGMDGPEYGGRSDPYQVLLVLPRGDTRVFETYPLKP